MRWFLRSKIHRATVTEAHVDYVGSITIDEALLEQCGMLPGEKVLVVDMTNGERLETYVIPGPRDSGQICMNGAAALRIKKGDHVIIMGFELAEGPLEAQKILVDENNRLVREL
jgi:aspartate 1-decarboxylase